MKIPINHSRARIIALWLCTVALFACGTRMQGEPPRVLKLHEPTVVGRDADSRTWQRVTEYMTSYGRVVSRTNRYEEIGTGMHYWSEGAWKESEEVIELFADGAIARKGPHQVIFSPSITAIPAIDVQTPDGKRLQCRIWGLVYYDPENGRSALIAEPKESVAQLTAANRLEWRDAFDGVNADVRCVYTKAGLETDVVLHERVSPQDWRFGENARLQVWTEFFDAPEPAKRVSVLTSEADPQRRQFMVSPDLVDETLDFGVMQMNLGTAFEVGAAAGDDLRRAPVAKQWANANGRQFLIESVEYSAIKQMLEGVPVAANHKSGNKGIGKVAKSPAELIQLASHAPRKPKASDESFARRRSQLLSGVPNKSETRQLASKGEEKGLLLDWSLLSSSSNFVFRSDSTYYVSSDVSLTGTTILEPTVIKFTNSSTLNRIVVKGPLDCRTSIARPAIFTAKDDDTVGQKIGGSTGVPTNYYASAALMTLSSGTAFDVHDLHVRYADVGISQSAAGLLSLTNVQVGLGNAGIQLQSSGEAVFGNILLHDLRYAFVSSGKTNRGSQLTVHRVDKLRNFGTVHLTNSLLIAVTNGVVFSGSNVETNQNEAGIFQTAGSGKRYLANNSPYRNAGTTNIDSATLAVLKLRTTYPPILLTNDISVGTTLSPQAGRDTDTPDLGYHYDPIDFLIGSSSGITLTNATLLLTNGVAIAMDASSTNWGLRLHGGGNLMSQGSPVNLDRIFWNYCAQETPTTATNGVPLLCDTYPAPGTPGTITLRFTEVPLHSASYMFNQENGRGTFGSLDFRHCQFGSGSLYLYPSVTNENVFCRNNLFDRSQVTVYSYAPQFVSFDDNLFREGSLSVSGLPGSEWNYYNNLFDKTAITSSGNQWNDQNAYVAGYNRLSPTGTFNLTLTATNLDYQTGPLGRYYYPTNGGQLSNLLDAGYGNANSAGLYHFTLRGPDQRKETNSVVDIGFHYVALDGSGQPIDGDSDGFADYFEDRDGDGVYDASDGETDWQSYNSLFGIGTSPGLQVFTPLK